MNQLFWCSTTAHVETVETISSGLAIPNFFFNLGRLRDTYQFHEGGPGVSREAVKKALLTASAAGESVQFFDTIQVVALSKEALKSAKSVFWGALLGFDLMNIFDGIRNAETLEADLKSALNPVDKEILQHRINHNFLSIAQSATLVAMASIALVSILFVSLAQGILFSPIVFLSLSSAWIILNYTTYFYGKMIDRWDEVAFKRV